MMKVRDLKAKKDPCGIHACLRHAMRLNRWMGYFPVQGLDQLSSEGTRFKFRSFYIIYYVFTIIGQLVMSGFCLYWFFQNDITLVTITNVIFYVTGLISAFLFLRLAHQWPKLIKKAEEIERSLTIVKPDKYAMKKSSTIAYVIMALAFIEHLLCTNFNIKLVMRCQHAVGITEKVMQGYVIYRMPYLFNFVSYNLFIAALAEFICIQATFVWSFTDVLTICFSIYLTSYFNSLNKYIFTKKHNDNVSWGELRTHYSKIIVLVKKVDDHISSFILLSFFTDLFFICLQLFNSLHRNYASYENCGALETKSVLSSPDYLLYFLYSFLFLVLRTLSLSLFAANVHSAAQEPVIYLYDVPSSEYDQEVERFQLQLRLSKISLSGKFFHVTRNMVLQVIGTIITYELVLLQFSIKPKTISETILDNSTTTSAY